MNRGARQVPVDGLQVRLFPEDYIGGVLALVHAPVVPGGEVPIDRSSRANSSNRSWIRFASQPSEIVCAFCQSPI